MNREAFEQVYRDERWGFGSGHGSLPHATRRYRRFIEEFLVANRVSSVLDYGCGDWQFSRLIDWQGARYYGVDVVSEVIAEDNRRYARPGVEFMIAPDDAAELPEADLLICKDVLQHLPNEYVHRFLETVAPRFPMSLIVNDSAYYPHELNRDIRPGDWRPLDVRSAPFGADAVVIKTIRFPRVRSGLWPIRGPFNGGTKPVMLVMGR